MSRSRKVKMHSKKHTRLNKNKKHVKNSKKHVKNSKKHVKNSKKHKIHNTTLRRKMRGGYGPGTSVFPGSQWNATGIAYYYPYNTNGIGPGGTPIFPGNNSPSPQHGGSGGLMQQLAINPYRGAIGSLGNLANIYYGRSLAPSPYPQYQDTLLSQKH